MSSWADESEDVEPRLEQAPPEYTGGGGVRPRLQLKPRSTTGVAAAEAQDPHRSSKSNPFGAAKPREQGELLAYFNSQLMLRAPLLAIWFFDRCVLMLCVFLCPASLSLHVPVSPRVQGHRRLSC